MQINTKIVTDYIYTSVNISLDDCERMTKQI